MRPTVTTGISIEEMNSITYYTRTNRSNCFLFRMRENVEAGISKRMVGSGIGLRWLSIISNKVSFTPFNSSSALKRTLFLRRFKSSEICSIVFPQ